MRFTQGYWVIRQDYVMSYATQTVRVIKNDKELHIISACRPIRHRGDILDGGSLDIVFTAPRKNIIRVQVTHFAGTPRKDPQFTTYEEDVTPEIREDDDYAYFTSGDLTARVSKGGNWSVDYMVGDRVLTTSGWRGMGRALKKDGTPCSLLPHGTSYMSESLQLDVGECVYGLGERFGAYVKNGQTVDMWNADGGTASELAYKNIPFYMTNRGYGVLVENASDVSFEVATEKVERVQFSHEGETMVYDVIYGGTPKDTLDLYTALTGRPALVPAWSFGLWLSTSFTTNYDEQTTSSFINGMAERDIPLSVFHFDCYWMKGFNWCDFEWDHDTFPDPVGMLKRYHEKGLHICCWINPYIGQASPLFKEGMEHGYLLKKTDGILPAILNTLYVIVLTLLIVLPLGVGAAVYLTEYASNRKLIEVIEFTNETLAGIPSILYGLVGMLVFAQTLGFKTCLLSGSLTLVVMNLPTIIRTTQESLKTVPQGYREGALGLGAGKWHIIRTIVLPCSIDGIVTGCILAVGRIVGESAALLFTAGAAEVIAQNVVKAYTSNGATLSVLLYLRAFEDGDFDSAWAIGAVLLVLVLAINLAARLAKTKLKQKQ